MGETPASVLEEELRRLESEPPDGAQVRRRIDLSNELAWEIALSDGPRARRLSEENFSESQSLAYERGLAFARRNLAYFDMMETRLEAAYRHMREAADSLRRLHEDGGLSSALDSLCLICLLMGDFEQARRYAHETLVLTRDLDDLRGQAWAHHNLGWVQRELKNHRDSEEHFQESLQLFRQVPYAVGEVRVLGRLGALYQDQGRLEEARKLHEECLVIAEELQIPLVLASVYNDLAAVLRQSGDQAARHAG